MNVAVADDSPLGRYLAELDAADGASSTTTLAAQLTQAATPAAALALAHAPEKARHPDKVNTNNINSNNDWRVLGAMQRHAQLFALEELLAQLTTTEYTDDLREWVLDAAGASANQPNVRWWLLHLHTKTAATTRTIILLLLLVVVFLLLSAVFNPLAIPPLSAVMVVLLPVAFACLAVETIYQAHLLYYAFLSRRFLTTARHYGAAKTDFENHFHGCLDRIKKAELATRGYRLGRILPPVGRLEEASSARDASYALQCRRIRVALRDSNDAIETAGRQVATRVPLTLMPLAPLASCDANTSRKDDVSTNTPSLLVTSLVKRHELVHIMLHKALQETLVDDLARVSGQQRPTMPSLPCVLSSHTQTLEMLATMMTSLSRGLLDRSSKRLEPRDERPPPLPSTVPSLATTSELRLLSHALAELQASCETLQALANGTQHAVVDGPQLDGTGQVAARQIQSLRLRRSRDQMSKRMAELTSDWQRLDSALAVAMRSLGDRDEDEEGEDSSVSMGEEPVPEEEDNDAVDSDHLTSVRKDAEGGDENDFLVVFTATSTGEKDFDLQDLLKRQQQQQQAQQPVPSFMRELHDVLEHRQVALPNARTLEKRMDGDDAQHSAENAADETTTATVSSCSSPVLRRHEPVPVAAAAPPCVGDIQRLLQSRFKAQLVEENFGESDEEDEDEIIV